MTCFVVVVLKLLFWAHLKGMKSENIQKLRVVLMQPLLILQKDITERELFSAMA